MSNTVYPFETNIVIELIFPYSIAEGGGICVPMYSNKCSEIEKYLEYQSICPFAWIGVGCMVAPICGRRDHSCGSGFPVIPSSAFPSFLLSFPCGSSFPGIPSFLPFRLSSQFPFLFVLAVLKPFCTLQKKIRRRSPPNCRYVHECRHCFSHRRCFEYVCCHTIKKENKISLYTKTMFSWSWYYLFMCFNTASSAATQIHCVEGCWNQTQDCWLLRLLHWQ